MKYGKYLKSFVIGSCAFATVPWIWSQALLRKKENVVNYDYYSYSWQMPIRRGLCNIFSLFISDIFSLSLRNRFIVITFIDWILTLITNIFYNTYNYNHKEWINYGINLFIKYLVWWNIIIYNLEKYIS